MGGDPEEEGESSSSAAAPAPPPTQFFGGPAAAAGGGSSGAGAGGRPGSAQTLRVRRSTYVPGWAVPPRVLLVDDDAVSRKVSSKFLQIFGCTIDVAVDGVGAVNKMNLEKYDLVLMVRGLDVFWGLGRRRLTGIYLRCVFRASLFCCDRVWVGVRRTS